MNLRKFLVAGFTAVMMAGFGALASSAASVPNIQVRSNGAENEYEVTLQNVSSETYGVQFDLTVDSDKDVTVNWADGDSGNIQKAVQTATVKHRLPFMFPSYVRFPTVPMFR